MSDLQVVRFAPDVEIQRGGDGRTVHGILVPWDSPARVYDQFGPTGQPAEYDEAIARGSFPDAVADPKRVKFLGHHVRRANPLGRGGLLRDDASGLYGEMYVSKTVAGDEVLELVRDGALDSFSVGFLPVRSEDRGGIWTRTLGRLNEVSIVTFPAYAGALVGGVRAQDLPPEALTPGVGEPSAEDGSGDQQSHRTGMTPSQRDRAIAVANLQRIPS